MGKHYDIHRMLGQTAQVLTHLSTTALALNWRKHEEEPPEDEDGEGDGHGDVEEAEESDDMIHLLRIIARQTQVAVADFYSNVIKVGAQRCRQTPMKYLQECQNPLAQMWSTVANQLILPPSAAAAAAVGGGGGTVASAPPPPTAATVRPVAAVAAAAAAAADEEQHGIPIAEE